MREESKDGFDKLILSGSLIASGTMNLTLDLTILQM